MINAIFYVFVLQIQDEANVFKNDLSLKKMASCLTVWNLCASGKNVAMKKPIDVSVLFCVETNSLPYSKLLVWCALGCVHIHNVLYYN